MVLTIGNLLTCIGLGLVTGVVSALCGVGGGIIMVPAFGFFLGLDQKQAVATSLAAVILVSLAGSFKNHTNSLVEWKVTLVTGLAAALVAWFAAGWLKEFSNTALTRMFAVLMIVMGGQMLWKSRGA